MPDQASKLREMFQSAAALDEPACHVPPMIVVSGGRPGVGATTIAVNLAAILADGGERVVVIDAAMQEANLASVAGIELPIEQNVDHVASGKCSAVEALRPGPAGVLVMPARGTHRPRASCKSREWNSLSPKACELIRQEQQRLLRELQSLHQVASLLVVDAGSGLTAWARRLWLRASLVLLVTTPEDAALVDAYTTMKCAVRDKLRTNVRLLINQSDHDKVATDASRRFSMACQKFLTWPVVALPPVPRHIVEKAPLAVENDDVPRVWESPNSPFGHALLWLGRAVAETLPLADKPGRRMPSVHEYVPSEFFPC